MLNQSQAFNRIALAAPRQAVLWAFGVWIAGVAAAGWGGHRVPALGWGLAALFFWALAWTWRARRLFFAGVAAAVFALGAFYEAVSFESYRAHSEDLTAVMGRAESVIECAVSGRYRRSGEWRSTRFVCSDIRWMPEGGAWNPIPGAIAVTVPRDKVSGLAVGYGTRVRLEGKIIPIKRPTNPAEWNEVEWRRTEAVFAKMRARSALGLGEAPGFGAALARLRARLINRVRATHRPEGARLVEALILGETETLDTLFKRALAATGTFHLFAVSGFQVSAVFGVVFALVGRSPLRRFRWIAALAAVGVYAALAGAQAPVVRAVWMAVFMALAAMRGRDPVTINALGGAGLAILIARPEESADRGFILSFASVFALAVIGRRFWSLGDWRGARSDERFRRIGAGAALLAKTSVAAWLGTLPWVAHFFGGIPLLAPVWNVWAVPLFAAISAVTWISFAVALLPGAAGHAAAWVVWPAEALGWVFERSILWTGESGLGVWRFAPPPLWLWAAVIAGVVWALWGGVFGSPARRMIASVTIALIPLLGWDIGWNAARGTRVSFLDIGQGDAALIETPTAALLIDTGPPGSAFRVIEPYLQSRGIARLDAVVLTHPQLDHAGDLESLVGSGKVKRIWHNGDLAQIQPYAGTIARAAAAGIEVASLQKGQKIYGLGSIECEVLWPDPRTGLEDLNDRSLVMRFRSGATEFVLTGDAGEDGLGLIEPPERVEGVTRVYKIPHHGAKIGPEGIRWLQSYHPDFAVVSAGRGNRYGHPNPQTLAAALSVSARTLRTDRDGAIQFLLSRDGRIREVVLFGSGEPSSIISAG